MFTNLGDATVRVISIPGDAFERQCFGCLRVRSDMPGRDEAVSEAETHARHCSAPPTLRR